MTFAASSPRNEAWKGKVQVLCSKRWRLAYIGSLGFFFVYSLRLNLSLVIICMVRSPAGNTTNSSQAAEGKKGTCEEDRDRALDENMGEFDWDKNTQGLILSSFYYGYISTNILGGWLAGVLGGRRVWGVSMLVTALATLLVPVGSRASYKILMGLRAVIGLAQGVCFPCMHSLLGNWAPMSERSTLAAFIYMGQNVGSIVTYMLSGVLCRHGFDHGWASVFYISGAACLLWVLGWFLISEDSPETHQTISEQEKHYILADRGNTTHRDIVVPWWSIATSKPLWACLGAHTCANWLIYTILSGLPTFMKEVLKYDIGQNGILSSIPFITTIVTMVTTALVADFVRRRFLSTTHTRKIIQAIAFLGAGACMVSVGFVDCQHRVMAVVLLGAASGFTGLSYGGYLVNHVDFAPRYAGVLMGITNTVATVPGIIVPIIIAKLTPHKSQEEWRVVFYLCGGFCLLGTFIFSLLASGELQPWATPPDQTQVEVPTRKQMVDTQVGQVVDTQVGSSDAESPDYVLTPSSPAPRDPIKMRLKSDLSNRTNSTDNKVALQSSTSTRM